MVSLVYMRIFLPESNMEAMMVDSSSTEEETTNKCLLEKGRIINQQPIRTSPSLYDSISLLKSRYVIF